MTILFSENDFKYNIEAIVKLFFPAEIFNFQYDSVNADGDICSIRLKRCKRKTYVYAYLRLDNKSTRGCSSFLNDTENLEALLDFEACKLCYNCLSILTGIVCDWGLLTGIRPVKMVNKLEKSGMNSQEIRQHLKQKYLVTDKKLDLAMQIADVQKPLLEGMKSNSVSLYIGIPFCPSRCSYCSFVSHSIENASQLIPEYVDKLCDEIEIIGRVVDELGLFIDTIYFGGGTPTAISADELYKIMKKTAKTFDLSSIREYNVEAGRADTITEDKLKVIKSMGADRISINPQTLNDHVLEVIGRRHTAKQVLDAYELARKCGFGNINMDLIAGLPEDSFASFEDTLSKVIELDPESVTVHVLTLKRSANLFWNGRENIHNPAEDMVNLSQEELIKKNYRPYYLYRQKNTVKNLENVGFAKKDFESLYNIFIMDEIQTILGAGCGASTKLVAPSGKIQRIHNHKFPYEYISRFDAIMAKKAPISEFYSLII